MARRRTSSNSGSGSSARARTETSGGYAPVEIPQRSVLQEGREALLLMHESYPQLLDLMRRYGPDFARAEVTNALARSSAESEGIRSNYGDYRDAVLGSSPEISAANQSIQDRFRELGPSAIEDELNRQALADLQRGGELSAEDYRAAIQTSRASASARGLATGQGAAVAEVLNRQNYADARQAERRAFAGGVDAYSQNRAAANANTANNLFNTTAAYWDPQQRLYGVGGSAVSGQVNGANQIQPFLDASQEAGRGNQAAALAGAQLGFDRYRFEAERADSAYYFDRNAALDASNAAANRSAANSSAAIGAIGSIGAAAMLMFL